MFKNTLSNQRDLAWQLRPLVLSLAEFDDTNFEWIEDTWEALDVRICNLAALQRRDPHTWQPKLAALIHASAVPRLTTAEVLRQIDRATRMNDLWFIAVNRCREYVGLTVLSQHSRMTKTYCARLTGVVTAYQRQGMATVLKVHALRCAALLGACTVETYADNPLLELNLRLGFRPK